MISNGITRCRYAIQEVPSLDGVRPLRMVLTNNNTYYKIRQKTWRTFGEQAYIVYYNRYFVSVSKDDWEYLMNKLYSGK